MSICEYYGEDCLCDAALFKQSTDCHGDSDYCNVEFPELVSSHPLNVKPLENYGVEK